MKKHSKVRKNNFRLNRNLFIFQGIIISLLLFLAWGSWIKFIIYVALEITVYCTLIYFLVNQANQKSKSSRKEHKKAERNSRGLVEFSEPKVSRKAEKKFQLGDSKPDSEQKSSSNNTQNTPNKTLKHQNLLIPNIV
jgi:hypothetical protein